MSRRRSSRERPRETRDLQARRLLRPSGAATSVPARDGPPGSRPPTRRSRTRRRRRSLGRRPSRRGGRGGSDELRAPDAAGVAPQARARFGPSVDATVAVAAGASFGWPVLTSPAAATESGRRPTRRGRPPFGRARRRRPSRWRSPERPPDAPPGSRSVARVTPTARRRVHLRTLRAPLSLASRGGAGRVAARVPRKARRIQMHRLWPC